MPLEDCCKAKASDEAREPVLVVRPHFMAFARGAWGAWLGFRGYFGISFNADTLAPIFVAGFYVFFTLIGLLAGAASAALIGGSVESLLRRFGAGIVASLSVATLVKRAGALADGRFRPGEISWIACRQRRQTPPQQCDRGAHPCRQGFLPEALFSPRANGY